MMRKRLRKLPADVPPRCVCHNREKPIRISAVQIDASAFFTKSSSERGRKRQAMMLERVVQRTGKTSAAVSPDLKRARLGLRKEGMNDTP